QAFERLEGHGQDPGRVTSRCGDKPDATGVSFALLCVVQQAPRLRYARARHSDHSSQTLWEHCRWSSLSPQPGSRMYTEYLFISPCMENHCGIIMNRKFPGG